MDPKENKNEIKKFLIKLIAITLAIIIVINVSYNLIFENKFEKLNMFFSLSEKENIEILKNKIRIEIKKGIKKDKIIQDEDRELLIQLYKKLEKELNSTGIE